MENQSFILMKNIGQIIIIRFVFFIVFLFILFSCYQEKSIPVTNNQVIDKLDKFINNSNYQTINKEKKVNINFLIRKKDTIVYFERISPYKTKNYLGCFNYKGFEVYLYSNFKKHNNKFYNKEYVSKCGKIQIREIDLTYRMDYLIKDDSLIPAW